MRGADAAVGFGVAVDVAGAVHADAIACHTHPVGEGGADVAVVGATVFAAIAPVNLAAVFVEGAEDGGAFFDDLFLDAEGAGGGSFSGLAGADGGVDGDLFFFADEELGALVGEVDLDAGFSGLGGVVEFFVSVNVAGLLVVIPFCEGDVGITGDGGDVRAAGEEEKEGGGEE